MKTLYIDCGMGAAGDMLTAALLELLPDREAFTEELNHIGIPEVTYRPETAFKCGIKGIATLLAFTLRVEVIGIISGFRRFRELWKIRIL